jgi:elongation factor Ts
MTEITPDLVKKLRDKTGAGMMDCKRTLQQTGGDIEKAIIELRKKGKHVAESKLARAAKEGVIASYIHLGGKVGVLVEVNCESDFVARNEVFKEFVKDITLQIAAASPRYVSRDQVPAAVIEAEKEIHAAQLKNKPPQMVENILAGKLNKFFSVICLLEQPFIKDTEKTVKDHLTQTIATIGENIVIRRFVRFEVGQELPSGN